MGGDPCGIAGEEIIPGEQGADRAGTDVSAFPLGDEKDGSLGNQRPVLSVMKYLGAGDDGLVSCAGDFGRFLARLGKPFEGVVLLFDQKCLG